MRRVLLWALWAGSATSVAGCADSPTEGETEAAGVPPSLWLTESGSYGGGRVWRSELRIDSVTGQLTYLRRGSMAPPPGDVEASRTHVLPNADVAALYRATQHDEFRRLRADYSTNPTPPDGGGFTLIVIGNRRERRIGATGLYALPTVLASYLDRLRAFARE